MTLACHSGWVYVLRTRAAALSPADASRAQRHGVASRQGKRI